MSNASEIKKPNYQKAKLTETEVEQTQISLLGKPLTVHFSIVRIQLGELEGNSFIG